MALKWWRGGELVAKWCQLQAVQCSAVWQRLSPGHSAPSCADVQEGNTFRAFI